MGPSRGVVLIALRDEAASQGKCCVLRPILLGVYEVVGGHDLSEKYFMWGCYGTHYRVRFYPPFGVKSFI